MPTRYTDLSFSAAGMKDFVVRKRHPTIMQLAMIFLSALLISISLSVATADRVALITILCVLLATAAWYVIIQIQRSRDLLLATEFQNALFASALGLNNKFCLIIKRDGTIIYLDRAFQDMFPDFIRQPRRSIDVLLSHGRVTKEDSEKIFSCIDRGVYDKVIFDIRGGDNEYHKMVVSIEPIMRPSGFILLRGREFVEVRSKGDAPGAGKQPGMLSKSTITLFSYVMDTMNMGVYMTGPSGDIIYANPVLEYWLDYREGEIAAAGLSLQDIVIQPGSRREVIDPTDYEGEVILQKRTGGRMKSFINQKIIRDEQNKIIGCTAIVHHFVDENSDVKKKLW